MKFFAALLWFAFAIVAIAQNPTPKPKAEVPMVTARTSSSSGKKTMNYITSSGWNYNQKVNSMGVDVEYRFLHKPLEAVDVQCFFVTKNDGTKTRYVYDFAVAQSKDQAGHFEFRGTPLTETTMGGGKKWANVSSKTPSGQLGDGSKEVELNLDYPVYGSKVEGWIVRVVSGGNVLKIESNQPGLSTLAKEIPAILDAIAAKGLKRR